MSDLSLVQAQQALGIEQFDRRLRLLAGGRNQAVRYEIAVTPNPTLRAH